jgi:hypothetical protein
MAEIVDIALSDLLVDPRNARLKEEQPSQPAAIIALAKQQGRRLLQLADDIVEFGLDPTALPAVVPTGDQKTRYTVIEGNRRVVAVKALETPSLVAAAFDSSSQKRLNNLSQKYLKKPISTVKCVLFESEAELAHWVTVRHTGQNDGVGLVEWGADEKDRYSARHGKRSPAGQVLDFVDKSGTLSDAAKQSSKGIITSLTRLINTPAVRDRLGIELVEGEVVSMYPAAEVAKGLSRVVDDLKTGRVTVGAIYSAEERVKYGQGLPKPKKATRLKSPEPLSGTGAAGDLAGKLRSKQQKRVRVKRPTDRTALIPRTCGLTIAAPRINALYNELLALSVDQYPNACAVAMRVFLELSVDNYVVQNNLMTADERRNTALAKRMKAVAAALRKKNLISDLLQQAVQKMADSPNVLASSTMTFNQYVHNQYVYPKPTELRTAWDEVQPLMEKLWP